MRTPNVMTAVVLACAGTTVLAQDGTMSFFVTSANLGQGADLGGLEGADAYCNELASAAGAEGDWKAYLSTDDENARDRIGAGPWHNAEGTEIAADVEALHGEGNMITKEAALDEMGMVINGRGDDPNRHDILTGSMPDGTAAAETCEGWTSSGEGSAMVGHHDRMGLDDSEAAMSWNSSHPSRGCGLKALQGTGGDGRFYCFAAN